MDKKKKIQQIPSRNKKTIQTDANFRLEILNHHLLLEVENFLRIPDWDKTNVLCVLRLN